MFNPGYIQVSLSEDEMTASITLRRAPDGTGLEMEQVQEVLSIEGVQHGVDWTALRDALYRSAQGETVKDVVIARGTPPRQEVPPGYLYAPQFRHLDPVFRQILPHNAPDAEEPEFQPPPGQVDDHGKIDYKERNTIPLVHAGQLLAIMRPQRSGRMGTTVRGEMVAYETKQLTVLEPGENTRIEDNKVYSEADGRFVWDRQNFGVDTTLELSDDIGYKTGNIRFPGDLVLRGGIKDRFSLWVGGDLIAEKTLQVYDIFVGKNLEAREGLIGRGGRLRVRGDGTVKFIEHCTVDILGSLFLQGGALTSRISVAGSVIGPEHAKIVGGELIAGGSMEVHEVGNSMGVHTRIELGVNFVTKRTLEHHQGQIQKLAMERQTVSRRLKSLRSRKLQAYYQSITEQELALNQKIAELLEQIQPNTEAVLKVHGTLHPGVVVSIAGQDYSVETPQSRCQIHLDQSQGVITLGRL